MIIDTRSDKTDSWFYGQRKIYSSNKGNPYSDSFIMVYGITLNNR